MATPSTPTEPRAGPGREGARQCLFGAGGRALSPPRGAGPAASARGAPRSRSERQQLTHVQDGPAGHRPLCRPPSGPVLRWPLPALRTPGTSCLAEQELGAAKPHKEDTAMGAYYCPLTSHPPPSCNRTLTPSDSVVPPAPAPGHSPATKASHVPAVGAASETGMKCPGGGVCWGSFRGKWACHMEPPALFCL